MSRWRRGTFALGGALGLLALVGARPLGDSLPATTPELLATGVLALLVIALSVSIILLHLRVRRQTRTLTGQWAASAADRSGLHMQLGAVQEEVAALQHDQVEMQKQLAAQAAQLNRIFAAITRQSRTLEELAPIVRRLDTTAIAEQAARLEQVVSLLRTAGPVLTTNIRATGGSDSSWGAGAGEPGAPPGPPAR